MTITEAERQVRIARRRKRKARPGYRQEAAVRLKLAVTAALEEAALLFAMKRKAPDERMERAT